MWIVITSQWRHDGLDGVSSHHPHDCLPNRLFRQIKETSKLRVTGLCVGNSPVAGEFPVQMSSNAENVSIWWRHLDLFRLTISDALKVISSRHIWTLAIRRLYLNHFFTHNKIQQTLIAIRFRLYYNNIHRFCCHHRKDFKWFMRNTFPFHRRGSGHQHNCMINHFTYPYVWVSLYVADFSICVAES